MNSESQGGVCVVGSINSDITYRVPTIPEPGETTLASERLDAPGGKGANQAVAIAALGLDVEFIATIGKDNKGTELIASLEKRGVSTKYVDTSLHQHTGSAMIIVDQYGENSIVVHPGANHDLSEDFVARALSELLPSIVLAQMEIPIRTVLATAVHAKGTFVLNPAPMSRAIPRSQISEILRHVDILIPNRKELADLTYAKTPNTADEVIKCAQALDFSGDLVVTLGPDGAMVFPKEDRSSPAHIPAPRVEVIDTSGAGDAFCASLVSSIYRGHDLISSVAAACELASWSTTSPGAQIAVAR